VVARKYARSSETPALTRLMDKGSVAMAMACPGCSGILWFPNSPFPYRKLCGRSRWPHSLHTPGCE